MRVRKKMCTEEVVGTVKNKKLRGAEIPTLITVGYQVNGVDYEITESIKFKSETIKIGIFPIGQKKTPRMGDIKIGSSVRVRFNKNNPAEAFIAENNGWDTGC